MSFILRNIENIILYGILLGVAWLRLSVAIGNICFVFSLLFFICWCIKERINPYIRLSERVGGKLIIAYLVFLACFIPSIAFSDSPVEGIKQLLEMFVFRIMPFVVVVVTASNKAILDKLLISLMLIEVADCCVALYQTTFLHIYNAHGFGFHYLNLAGLLACFIPVVAVLAIDKQVLPNVKFIAMIAFAVLVSCAIVASKSRGLWLITIIVMTLIVFIYRKTIWENKRLVAVGLVGLMLSLGFFLGSERNLKHFESVVNTTSNSSNVARIYMWKSCIKMMEDYPISGVGLGNYRRYYHDYYEMAAVPEKGYGHPHNSYLHIGSQAGLPGIIAVALATVGSICIPLKKWLQKGSVQYMLLTVSWLGFALFGVLEPIIDSTVHAKLMSLLSGIFCTRIYFEDLEEENTNE